MDVMSAARCVPIRELSRSTGELVDEVERDGRAFAVSRHGRMVALLVPLPERLIIEFEDGKPLSPDRPSDVSMDGLELSRLASEFLLDAASTPTGYWCPSDSAHRRYDATKMFETLDELALEELAEWISGTKIKVTRKGRGVANTLRGQGCKGYRDAHGDPYLEP